MLRRHRFACTAMMMLLSGTALAQVDPLSGIDFVTVGAVGNAPWTGPTGDNNGFGRVDYEYKIGRFEVTTSQWVEFMNAALDRPASDAIPHVGAPSWGAVATTPQNGGRRWTVPEGREMLPVGGLSWRTCAIYCNWLHNDKSLDRSAFLSGAYDVSTFYYEGTSSGFYDQLTHNPDARYWIPTQSEWLKAAHYDPNKANTDGTTGGYWNYGNSSDSPFIYGPPGVLVNGQLATANAGWNSFQFPEYSPGSIALGAYDVTSPWGLYDVAGGSSEWLERFVWSANEALPTSRIFDGSARGSSSIGIADHVRGPAGSAFPSLASASMGFRMASSIPSPASGSLVCAWILSRLHRRRRRYDATALNDGGRTGNRWGRGMGRHGHVGYSVAQ